MRKGTPGSWRLLEGFNIERGAHWSPDALASGGVQGSSALLAIVPGELWRSSESHVTRYLASSSCHLLLQPVSRPVRDGA